MAKKKDSKGKSAKSKKNDAGAKPSMNLSQAGDLISSIVSSPMARELVADALIAVAGVLAGNRQSREAIAGAGTQAASGAKDLAQTATGAVAEVVADAARRILPSATGRESGNEAQGGSKGGGKSGSKSGGRRTAGGGGNDNG